MAPVLMKIPGAEYITGITPLMILAAGQVLSILAGPASSLLSMTKFPRITFYNSIIQFCLNVILDIVLIPKYGMAGAATATGISLILISIIRIIQIFFLLKIHPFSVSYFKPVLAGSVAFFSVKAVTLSGLSSPFPRTVMFIIIFSAAAFFMGIEKEEKYMFSLLKNYKLPPHNR
jgi:O-antigen/teichoic acid export membrane protein